jgi:hypothetical protein
VGVRLIGVTPAPTPSSTPSTVPIWRRLDGYADGLALDACLYLVSAVFAGFTAGSTLASHRAWGAVAVWGYAAAALVVGAQLLLRRFGPSSRDDDRGPAIGGHGAWAGSPAVRATLTALTWLAVAMLPLVLQAIQRAAGRLGRAQEEVLVVEDSAGRLVHGGTPYLSRDAIEALADPLLGYTPYQPGMSIFGLPRAAAGIAWWTDSRVWFALGTVAALALAVVLLRTGTRERDDLLVRAVQAATVLPLCALTLATGGDDLPVLALCLLALACAAGRRHGWAGVAVGAAAAMKLFAWPVAVVLGIYLLARQGRRAGGRFAIGAVGLPALALLPALLVDFDALIENVLRFPTGHGLVTSPAASPLLGRLLAEHVTGGRFIALGLLAAAAAGIAVWLWRRPPADPGAVAVICAVGLLIAIVLMPATRFGYLLYPVAFALWAPPLRPAPADIRLAAS